jgi:hypothetical protein
MVPGRSGPRMRLAQDFVPPGRHGRDEVFDHTSALGTTNFVADVDLRRHLGRARARHCRAARCRGGARSTWSWRGASRSGAPGSNPAHRSLRLLGGHRLSRPKAPAGRGRGPGRAARTDHARRRPGALLARGGGGAAKSALQDDMGVLVQAASEVAGVDGRWNSASPSCASCPSRAPRAAARPPPERLGWTSGRAAAAFGAQSEIRRRPRCAGCS